MRVGNGVCVVGVKPANYALIAPSIHVGGESHLRTQDHVILIQSRIAVVVIRLMPGEGHIRVVSAVARILSVCYTCGRREEVVVGVLKHDSGIHGDG